MTKNSVWVHILLHNTKQKMPSSSRKKNKGKDRKAKQAVEKEESNRKGMYNTWSKWVQGYPGQSIGPRCNHGFGSELVPEISHPVASFVTAFFMGTELRHVIQKHEEVLSDDDKRKRLLNIFISIGTNWMLYNIENQVSEIAHAIIILESYGITGDYDTTIASRAVSTKMRDIYNDRDVYKYYRKRTNCSCLKKIHLYTRKTQPKLGSCFTCQVVKERALLMVCSRCMVSHYCSRECQVAASAKHRRECDEYAKARELHT